MANVKHVIRYFALYYPYKNELSKARITKMVYLADWFSARNNRKQMTNIRWYFDHYGPFVTDVYEEAKKDRKLILKDEYTPFGTPKETVYLNSENKLGLEKLTNEEVEVLKEVIRETKSLNWSEFIDYVYDTFPIRNQKRYTFLDLVELAQIEKNNKKFKW